MSTTLIHQLDHLTQELQSSQQQNVTLVRQLSSQRTQERQNHEKLIDEIALLIKTRSSLENALLQQRESYDADRATDFSHFQV